MTVREAELAIQLLNNKDMGRGVRLVVKVAENRKSREERMKRINEEALFLNTLNCAQNGNDVDVQIGNNGMSEEEAEKCLRKPKYLIDSPENSTPTSVRCKLEAAANSKSPSFKGASDKESHSGSSPDGKPLLKPCSICSKSTSSRCSKCRTPYCSVPCQRKDWPRHIGVCGKKETNKPARTPAPATPPKAASPAGMEQFKIAEDLDDDGFVISYPTGEDLEPLKALVEGVKMGQDMAQFEVLDTKKSSSGSSSLSVLSSPNDYSLAKTPSLPGSSPETPTSVSLSASLPASSLKKTRSSPETPTSLSASLPASKLSSLKKTISISEPKNEDDSKDQKYCSISDLDVSMAELSLLTESVAKQNPPPDDLSFKLSQSIAASNSLSSSSKSLPSSLYLTSKSLPSTPVGGNTAIKPSLSLSSSVNRSMLSSNTNEPFLQSQQNQPGLPSRSAPVTPHSSLGLYPEQVEGQTTPSQFGSVTQPLQSPQNPKLLTMSYHIPCHKVEVESCVEILPTVVINPNIIWAQVVHDHLINMERMHDDLNSLYSPNADCNQYAPIIGELCVAKYSEDQKYYRAEVLCVNHSGTVDIRFVEFGRRETVTTSRLHRIAPIFCSLPKQALKFSMSGIVSVHSTSWSDNAVIFLREKILRRNVKVKIVSKTPTGYEIDLFDPDLNNQLLNNSLILLGHAQVARGGSQEPRPKTPLASFPGVAMVAEASGPQSSSYQRKAQHSDARKVQSSVEKASTTITPLKIPASSSPLDMPGFVPSPSKSSSMLNFVASTSKSPSNMPGSPPSNLPGLVMQHEQDNASTGVCKLSSPTKSLAMDSDEVTKEYREASSTLEKLLLSKGDNVEVCVSSVNTPLRFFVQVTEPSNLAKVEPLLDLIEQIDLSPMKKIESGNFCLCRYSEDNRVHRAKILNTKSKEVVVVFIDYGNRYNTKPKSIYKIPAELLQLPEQAVCCSLNEALNPAGKKEEWDKAAVEQFRKFVQSGPVRMKVVKVVGILHVVDLVLSTPGGDVDVLHKMCEEGCCNALTQPSNKRGQEDTADLEKGKKQFSRKKKLNLSPRAPAKKNKPRAPAVKKLPSFAKPDGTEIAMKDSPCASALPQNVYPLAADIESINIPKSSPFQVMVTEIVDPGEMYVQVATTEVGALLSKISEGINSTFTSSPPKPLPSPPDVGSLCCAKFSVDQQWYRVKVLQVDGSSCNVFFVDYGNKDVILLSNMTPCPSEYSSLPLIAARCGISRVSSGITVPSVEKFTTFLQQQTANRLVSASVQSECNGTPQLELIVEGVNLVDEMERRGIVMSKPSYPVAKDLEKIRLPESGTFQVMVTEVVGPTEIYVQVATTEVGALSSKISEGINSTFTSSSPKPLPSPPDVGSLCCAKFSVDQQWYRVEVLQVDGRNCNVLFVDYGNKDVISLSNMAPCPSEYSSLPLIAARCGISRVSSDITVPSVEKFTTFLQQQTANRLVSASVQSECNGTPQLELIVEGVNLVDEMERRGIVMSKPSYPVAKDLEKICLPESGTFQVMVTEVVGPTEIYVQVATTEVGALLSKISEGINSTITSSSPKPLSSPPDVGSLCCAKFSVDQQWYRVKVLQVDGSSCNVFFVDYGNKDVILLSNMAPCPSEYSSLPLIAARCGISRVSSGITVPSVEKFTTFLQQQTANRLVSASVQSECNGTPQLELIVEGVNLVDEMERRGIVMSKPSYPVAKDLEKIRLPESGTFQVMVTEVVGPTEIYVQVATTEVGALLSKISEGINSVFTSSPPKPLPSPPEVGSLCCAKFSVDQQWYRVKVLQVDGSSCNVFFMDYGNKDVILLSNMAPCPSEYSSLPLIAARCGISRVSSGITVPSVEKFTTFLQQQTANRLVSASVQSECNGTPQLELIVEGVNLVDEMERRGIVMSKPSYPVAKDLEKICLPESGTFQVMVTEVFGPTEIYVQVATTEIGALLSKISEGINSTITSSPKRLSSPPDVGSLCCAKFSVDQQWYRVKVLQVDGSSCNVFFVDYGNKDVISLSNMAPCPSEYSSLPLIAARCGISRVSSDITVPSVEKFTTFLQQQTANRLVSASVQSECNGTPQLELIVEGVNLVDEMERRGIVMSKPSYPVAKDLEKIRLPGSGTFQVMVTEVVGPTEIYVQVATTEVGALLSKISEGINSVFTSSPPKPLLSPPEVGSLCCAKFSVDQQWYRVKVLQVDGSSCNVFFVDYGNKDVILLSNMAPCPSEYSSLPLIAARCGISRVSSGITVPSVEKFTTFLQQQTANRLVSASVQSECNGTPQLELIVEGVNLVDEMERRGIVMSKPSYPVAKDLEKICLPESGTFQVMVTEVVGPTEIYVQVATTEVGALLSKISEGINSVFTSSPPKPLPSPPEVGSLCCAKFSVDQQWYRVEVLQVDGCTVKSFFVDFGNKETVTLSNMAACPCHLSSFPLVAVKCSFNDVSSSPSTKKVTQMTQFLQEHTANKILSAKVIGEINGAPQLELINGELNLLHEMVKVGLIVPEPSFPPIVGMKRMELPAVSDTFQAMVAEVVNFNKIYIHVATQPVAALLSEVGDGLKKFFDSHSPSALSLPPPVGSLCCAKFPQDSQWYRAEVTEVKGDTVKVFFIDYGNSESVPISCLSACPSQFALLPVAAVRCSLSGVSSYQTARLDLAVSFLKQKTSNVLLFAQVTSNVTGETPQIELKLEDTTLVSAMIKHGFLKMSLPSASTLTKLEFPHTADVVKVMILEVVTLSEIYLHANTKETSIALEKISKEINSQIANNTPQYLTVPPSIGSLCCARYLEDNSWCRVEILAIEGNVCKIFFVDYGNVDTVKLSDVVACPSQLLSLPQVAIKCGLSGAPPECVESEKAICLLKKLTLNSVLPAKFISEISEVPQIELLKQGTSILTKLGLEAVRLPFPMVASMKKCTLPESDSFKVFVCVVVSPLEMYLQVYSKENIKLLSTLTEGLNSFFQSNQHKCLTSSPGTGSLCCAKFSQDGMWYRVRVDGVNSSSNCKVFFIDYGNFEEVELKDMAACPCELADLPIMSVKCALYGVDELCTDSQWPAKASEDLTKLTSGRLLEASVVNILQQDCPVIQLIDNSNGTLLISAKFIEIFKSYNSSTKASIRKCQVTEVQSPSSFYIQYIDKENASNLSLLNKLQNIYSDPSPYQDYQPEVGSFCCSQYFADKCWYRCKVISVTKQCVRLLYIDFGTVENVVRSRVYALDERFTKCPPLAIPCKLGGIVPTLSEWTQECIKEFKSIVEGKPLYMCPTGIVSEESVTPVNLYFGLDQAASIANNLVSSGYAMYAQ